ncbi:hypothetical protein YC2023_067048 [Brassica napus]
MLKRRLLLKMMKRRKIFDDRESEEEKKHTVSSRTRDWFIPGDWRDGTSMDGNTYWLTNKYSPTGTRNAALQCFDFTKERFGLVSLPGDTLSYNVFALSVTREEQNLCLLASSHDEEVHDADVWMATKIKGAGDMSWSKLLTVKRTHSQQLLGFRKWMSFMVNRDHE